MPKKSLYLVDISSYVFRAYYGVRPLSTSKGVPTNATYGVVTMLTKLIREKKPDHLVVVFDSPGPSFRKEMYPEYKANREVPPEDLAPQFEHIKEFIKAYPLPQVQVEGFEADDLIATIVNRFRKREIEGVSIKDDLEVVIVSADKDLMQLIDSKVTMYDSMREKNIGIPEVKEKFGVGPEQVVEVLGLAGDTSDNVPGVRGVGEKTASKLISEWGSIENLYKNLNSITGKLRERLDAGKDNATLSKQLVILNNQVPLKTDWNCFELKEANTEKLNSFFRKYELKSLIKDTGALEPKGVSQSKGKYDLVTSEDDLKKWTSRLKNAKFGFAFDTETTGTDPLRCQLVGVSFSNQEGFGCYIPLAHAYLGCPKQLSQETVIKEIKLLLEDEGLPKIAQNAKFDIKVLSNVGIQVRGLKADTLIASYLVSPETPHNMDHLAQEYLGYETTPYDKIVPKGGTIDQVEIEKICDYASEDADITFRLNHVLEKLLKDQNLWDCYQNIELPLVEVLCRMEEYGVYVDQAYLRELSHEFGGRLKSLVSQIYEEAGVEFNVQSPKQLAEILFGRLKLPPQKKTKTGHSTDVDVLTILAKIHPLPKLLLQYRTLAKLQSTYVEQLQNLILPKTGRIHTNYNQTITATGRLSSTDPNLQNIPIRTDEGRRIRKAFRAPKGSKILSADYSQIELRLLAELSKDPQLVEAFQKNEDIHKKTAERIFGQKGKEITQEERAQAKTVNFGIIYGQSPFGLANQLDISQAEAREYIDQFYLHYPFVGKYREKALKEVSQNGEVRTWQGRKRLIPEINSQNKMVRQNAERTAFNTIFQGSAADLIKIAMIQIDKKLTHHFQTRMMMQVHDELVFEVPVSEVDAVTKLVKEEMENAVKTSVPLKVDISVGDDWGEAH